MKAITRLVKWLKIPNFYPDEQTRAKVKINLMEKMKRRDRKIKNQTQQKLDF